MKVFVTMIRHDLLQNEEETVYEGPALLNGSRLLYTEGKNARHCVIFSDDRIILRREADISSETVLYFAGKGECRVSSPYGDMLFYTDLLGFEKTDSVWSASYRISAADGIVSEQRIVWKLKKIN